MAHRRQRPKRGSQARRRAPVPPQAPTAPGRRDREAEPAAAPDPLAHASGEVDEFEAALASGSAADAATPAGRARVPEADPERQPAPRGEVGAVAASAREGAEAERRERARLGFLAFLQACWAELQRVRWPDRRQVWQATGVVLGFVVIAGIYLGVLDFVWQRVVDFII
jgi:preprotein translocase SecE subunit